MTTNYEGKMRQLPIATLSNDSHSSLGRQDFDESPPCGAVSESTGICSGGSASELSHWPLKFHVRLRLAQGKPGCREQAKRQTDPAEGCHEADDHRDYRERQ